jgi:hypothetical protein
VDVTDPINLWDVFAWGALGWTLGILTIVTILSLTDW